MKSVVLIGAGSAMFTQGLLADMIMSGRAWDVRLCDIDPEALCTAEALCRRMLAAHPSDVTVRASTDRRELLPGADVVVTTIAVGGRRSWEQDVHIPRKYGIFQPVGDSVLPGGISRGLRHVPAMVAIARDVQELCPGAWFFNYTNPMSVLCRAVRQATGVPVIGLCHGVHNTMGYLARFAGLPPESTDGLAVGVNHLTWFLQLHSGQKSAWPQVEAALGQRAAHDRVAAPDDAPFSWELFRTHGAFPAVLDRHVIEFFPMLCREKAYYGMTPGVDAFSFADCIAHGDRRYEQLYAQARGSQPLDMRWKTARGSGEHEQLVDILCSLWENRPRVYSANLPNEGQVTNLPEGAVIESPCLVDGVGFRPLAIGSIPEGIAGILRRIISSQQLTVDAALSGNRRLVAQALLSDGAVSFPHQAEALVDELLDAHRMHLPQFQTHWAPAGCP